MCKIKILGPASEKYKLLKNKLAILNAKWDEELEIIEIKEIGKIIKEDIEVVPSAILIGEKDHIWTVETSVETMLAQLKTNRENRNHECKCGDGCRMKKLDPSYSCQD